MCSMCYREQFGGEGGCQIAQQGQVADLMVLCVYMCLERERMHLVL